MSNYNKQIYYMYEEEVNKNKKFNIEIKELKLENKVLKQELTAFKNSFDNNLNDTLYNIEKNIINGKYQHTDETTTKENGKEVYYRAYANDYNVLYKYHHRKGDVPIEEDGILVNYFGTIISDHEVGIFKYGINNQDCIIHLGRYCMEKTQNVYNISWPMDLYRLLLRIEFGRKM